MVLSKDQILDITNFVVLDVDKKIPYVKEMSLFHTQEKEARPW